MSNSIQSNYLATLAPTVSLSNADGAIGNVQAGPSVTRVDNPFNEGMNKQATDAQHVSSEEKGFDSGASVVLGGRQTRAIDSLGPEVLDGLTNKIPPAALKRFNKIIGLTYDRNRINDEISKNKENFEGVRNNSGLNKIFQKNLLSGIYEKTKLLVKKLKKVDADLGKLNKQYAPPDDQGEGVLKRMRSFVGPRFYMGTRYR